MGCCRSFSGIARDCDSAIGGIKRVWISCYDGVSFTLSNDQITAISGGSWKEFEFKKQTGSVTQTLQTGDAQYYQQTITLQFTKQETAKKLELDALATSDLCVIVQDNNDSYWFFGANNSVTVTANEATSGTAFSDFNGYNVTLLGTDYQLAYEVTAGAMASIIS